MDQLVEGGQNKQELPHSITLHLFIMAVTYHNSLFSQRSSEQFSFYEFSVVGDFRKSQQTKKKIFDFKGATDDTAFEISLKKKTMGEVCLFLSWT